MGEEYGEQRPFQFFTDFKGTLAEAVRKGRNKEFRNNKAFAEAFKQELVPDPNALSTFTASMLEPETSPRTEFVKRLIATRFTHVVPRLAQIGGHAGKLEALHGDAFAVSWQLTDGGTLSLAANLSDTPAELLHASSGAPFFVHPRNAAEGKLPPWSVVASVSGQE